eukprot:m.239615 g.239615  ORF g.239615 m.239615 type:complete len:62 (+) comp40183_c0_seq6:3110-3295(+)
MAILFLSTVTTVAKFADGRGVNTSPIHPSPGLADLLQGNADFHDNWSDVPDDSTVLFSFHY